jgi:hypothetical protein
MVVRHLALVSESPSVKLADLVPAAAALQTQVIRDFAPVWRRPATVTAFNRLQDVPLDHWPMIVSDTIPYQAEGIHLDKDGSPFSLVRYSEGWTLTTSHEALEMLGDPLGKRTRRGPSPKQGQGDVAFLVEVCDPSEADAFAYQVNSTTVSDFYLPSFFDRTAQAGTRYSFTGAITKPRSILRGGYISWKDLATNIWWQQRWFNTPRPTFFKIGLLARGANPRRATDQLTEVPEEAMRPAGAMKGFDAAAALPGPPPDQKERAARLREMVATIVAAAQ